MSFRLELRPEVLDDVSAAAAWYDKRELGLGTQFASAIEQRLQELSKNPLSARIRNRANAVRWVYPRPFPYRIIYRVTGETILVIAVLHAARQDRHWKNRG